jgi:tetratricopeptide (TPR) repeat protein
MSFTRLLLAAIVISTSFLTAPLTGYSQKPADPESLAAYEKAEELSRKVNVLLRSASKETRTEAVLLLDNVVDLYVRAGSKKEAASYRNVQGVQFRLLGDTKRQLEAYQKALELYRSAGHREGEALSMFNIADVYSETGDTDKAIHYLQLCLPIFEAEKSLYYQSMVLRSLADLYRDLGSPREALAYKLKALAVDRTTTQTWNEADTLSEIAQLYTELGETERALSFLQQALSLVRKSKNFWGQSKVHNKLGQHYLGIGDAKSAQLHHTQALALIRRLDPGFVSLHGEATTLVHIAAVHAHARNWKQAESIFAEARSMIHRIGNPETDAWALQRIGRMHSEKGDLEAALKAFSEELQIRRSIGDKSGEALALYRVSESHAMAGSGRLAILFGKLSVNAYQELRKSLNAFDHEVRRSYMAIVETAYKHLADLLIEEGRLPEAQAVLAMLKEEEAFEYIRRDASETALLNRRADLREDEKAALKEYEKLAEAIGAVGAEFGKLQDAKSSLPGGASLSADDQKRLDELGKQLEAANTAFQVFLRQLAEEFEKKAVVQDIQENAGLQADLKGWGEGVVSLYTIVGEDRYRVVLTTPNVQVDGKTEIKGADLNKKIAAFRAAVQDTRIDPRPLGKEI